MGKWLFLHILLLAVIAGAVWYGTNGNSGAENKGRNTNGNNPSQKVETPVEGGEQTTSGDTIVAPSAPAVEVTNIIDTIKEDAPVVPQKRSYINGHEYVDLGLSVKWATCNVGASSPKDAGGYYAWGETTTKSDYSEGSYKYYDGIGYINIGNDISGTEYDVACKQWGGSWRLPTRMEMEELRDKCTWTWTTYKGVKGYEVTGPNGNSIFLPAAGYCDDTGLCYRDSSGGYCSGTREENLTNIAYYLDFGRGGRGVYGRRREYGRTVRPVSE